jgi:hypothetical protein
MPAPMPGRRDIRGGITKSCAREMQFPAEVLVGGRLSESELAQALRRPRLRESESFQALQAHWTVWENLSVS